MVSLQTPLGAAEIQTRLEREFPQAFSGDGAYRIEDAAPMSALIRLIFHDKHLRPGGTISGPAMFGLADCGLYVAVLATIGWVPLAVTTTLTLNFLSKPAPRDLLAHCRLLRMGKRLAVGEVSLRSEGSDDLVAHATGTYAIPTRVT
jgi:acyl-coenzyme A thioesterase PaaI-like protein